MTARRLTVVTLPTPEPSKVVEVQVFYDDGALRQSARGYWLSARIWQEEPNGLRSTDLFNGGVHAFLESATRFNAKRLFGLAHVTPAGPYQTVVARALAKMGLA